MPGMSSAWSGAPASPSWMGPEGNTFARSATATGTESGLAVRALPVAAAPTARITLIQAVPKGKIFESIIQKATELGVARVVPLLSDRVATRLDGAEGREKAEKWRQCAIEAIKQCGQPWLPEVEEPLSLPALLARGASFDLALVGSLQGDGRHARAWFQEYEAQHGRRPLSVGAWIGPEGDFTGEEMDLIRGAGRRPDRFGTAGLAQRNGRPLHAGGDRPRTAGASNVNPPKDEDGGWRMED